jgi:hypothetical protein
MALSLSDGPSCAEHEQSPLAAARLVPGFRLQVGAHDDLVGISMSIDGRHTIGPPVAVDLPRLPMRRWAWSTGLGFMELHACS